MSENVHILIVEDNEDTRILLRYILEPRFSVEAVSRVGEALEKTSVQIFDLLLIDINLGEELTGIDLLHQLRASDDYASSPMIAVTAYALPGDDSRFIKMGFDGYISKPFTRTELMSAVDNVLQTH